MSIEPYKATLKIRYDIFAQNEIQAEKKALKTLREDLKDDNVYFEIEKHEEN